jgi:hypothetical protein
MSSQEALAGMSWDRLIDERPGMNVCHSTIRIGKGTRISAHPETAETATQGRLRRGFV